MHKIRDMLLGPSPKGDTQQLLSLDNASKDREDILQYAAQGKLDSLRGVAFYNRVGFINDRYCRVGDGVDALEGTLHSLWYMYCVLGQYTCHESRDQDQLVLDIIRIQGNGPLTRPTSGLYGVVDVARTVEGTLWNDMPFLVTDMTDFWIDKCAAMSGAHRLNFASFLAKLASTRISKNRVCQIALVLFRITFEDGRRVLGDVQEPDQEDSRRCIRGLTIAQLLPAAVTWFKEAGQNLIQLSDVSWNDCPSTIGHGGQLFTESELGRQSPSGFTPWRWMFWLKRFHEIRKEAQQAGQKCLEEYTDEAIEFMTKHVEERNSEILRAYQANAEIIDKEEALLCLKDLVSAGIPSSSDN